MSTAVSTSATSRQMSLELFEEMLATDTPIHKATKEIGYQRNNVFVDVTDVGVTARRLLDAFRKSRGAQTPLDCVHQHGTNVDTMLFI